MRSIDFIRKVQRARMVVFTTSYAANAMAKDARYASLFLSRLAKAMLERAQPVARDLYDAWFLSKKYGIGLDAELASKKMALYGKHGDKEFSMHTLEDVIGGIGHIWYREMGRLISHQPAYAR